MAKRTAAAHKTRKVASSKVRKSNVLQINKAIEARRIKLSPELEARGRYLFEETDRALSEIAFELGMHKSTVPIFAKRRRWKRYVPPPRDISPAMRILVEAEGLERRRESPEEAQPDSAGGESEHELVSRLRRAVVNELTVVETLRDRLKNEPQAHLAAERTARTLATLTDTLQKLQRLQCAVPASGSLHDIPADIDEFRNELARRIETFVASRTDAEDDKRPGSSQLAPPVRD